MFALSIGGKEALRELREIYHAFLTRGTPTRGVFPNLSLFGAGAKNEGGRGDV